MVNQKIGTMEEFAHVSGISRPTLSKYFNDPASVRQSTRERIERALQKYDYRPNLFAVNQNRKFTKNIGILVPYIGDPFFSEIMRHIEMRCLEAGYWPIVLSSHGESELENNALETLSSLKLAGAVIAPLGHASSLNRVRQFAAAVPTVIFDSNPVEGQVFVGTNNFQTVNMMVDYLCRTGEPPCFLEMPEVNNNAQERRVSYVQAMEKLGFEPFIMPLLGDGWGFEQLGYEAGLHYITKRGFPASTVLCANDRLAIGLMAAAHEKGLRVGRGAGCAMRIAGHDDHPLARFTCPSLTTIAQDFTAIAEKSVQMLFALIGEEEEGDARPHIRLDGKLVLRASA